MYTHVKALTSRYKTIYIVAIFRQFGNDILFIRCHENFVVKMLVI